MKLEEFFKDHEIPLTGKTLVVAASGGPDSMALIDLLCKLREKYQFKVVAAHYDHQLRADSDNEKDVLSYYCQAKKVQLINGTWDKKDHPKTGLEAAARAFRYRFLIKSVHEVQGDYLLTAHHGDDLLENILLKLIRSGNPEEMNGLQAVGKMYGVTLLRPLLAYSKQELLNYNVKNQIKFVEDETNFEDETMRNRLRHHVIPLLKQENEHLLDNGLRFSQAMATLSDLSKQKVEEIGPAEHFLGQFYRLPVEKMHSFTEKEQNYYWQNFIWQKYGVRSGDELSGFTLKKYQNYFYLWSNQVKSVASFEKIKLDQEFEFQNRKFVLTTNKKALPLYGDFWSSETEFFAGNLPSGSRLIIKNGQHVKSKKMFAQAAIPGFLRSFCLTIFDQKQRPIFVEKTYQNQTYDHFAKHYYLYDLKKQSET